MRLIRLLILILACTSGAIAASAADDSRDFSIRVYDRLLGEAGSDNDLIILGDMVFRAAVIRHYRDVLAGNGMVPESSVPANVVTWPGGRVYYAFAADITSAHRQAFRDAAAEWSMFGNVRFIQRTTQADYMDVQNASFGGGQSAVGKVGGPQTFLIGSWNRFTLLHEMGHTLGLIHEHQRTGRSNFVKILTANIQSGAEPNFTLIPNSMNHGAYDFYSVMHYERAAFSIDPATKNTIEPKPAYAQFLDIIGKQYYRPLSKADRDGMAFLYGAGPALGSVVTNTQDSGVGSLRAALYHAFDNPGTTITFNIPVSDPNFNGTVFTIRPSDQLFAAGADTIIDGTTQPGNYNSAGPEILLSGASAPAPEFHLSGLRLMSSGCTVRGLCINRFSSEGILIIGSAATNNHVEGCYIGTNATGQSAAPNLFGIRLLEGANYNVVGDTTVPQRNIISGNTYDGVSCESGSNFNTVEGNYIGVKSTGTAALPNGSSGISLSSGAHQNWIGLGVAGARNVISGNLAYGLIISGAGTQSNLVYSNFIGLTKSGMSALGNGYAGIGIFNGATGNIIGNHSQITRNVISGNGFQGVVIGESGTNGNALLGNYIGVDKNGVNAVPNTYEGITIYGGASSNNVGGPDRRFLYNVISGNGAQGIAISGAGTTNNKVQGNYIGLDSSGATAVGNLYAGVGIFGGAQGNLIGGTGAEALNIISGNGGQGVAISGAGTNGNKVRHNNIGTNAAGDSAIANQTSGISIFGAAKNNEIGGLTASTRNVISGNLLQGLTISDPGTTGNLVANNYIGLGRSGAAPGNGWSGIDIFGGAKSNTIGGVGAGNALCANGASGIGISGAGTDSNVVIGNFIGVNPVLLAELGNAYAGVTLYGGAKSNSIGTSVADSGNVIAFNGRAGVEIYDNATIRNLITSNSIYNNTNLGINLVGGSENAFGVTSNDNKDPDVGPNRLQNFPIITSAASNASSTSVAGNLNSVAQSNYYIEFFSSSSADASTYGEGANFLGGVSVTTNANGVANFSVNLPASVGTGSIVTATARSSLGDTSEFSKGVSVAAGP